MRKELEKRLIDLSVNIIRLCRGFDTDHISQHLAGQIIRSSSSAALNYGEAQGAESKNDFIHKTSIVLKELRETHINLLIISRSELMSATSDCNQLIDECNQLVAIFHRTVLTAKNNREK